MATIPEFVLHTLAGLGRGENQRRSVLRQNQLEDRRIDEAFGRQKELINLNSQNRQTASREQATLNALTQLTRNTDTRQSAVKELNRLLGTDINIQSPEIGSDIGTQIGAIAGDPNLDDNQKRIELFKIAANNKGITFSDVQKLIDSPGESKLLGEQLKSQQALTRQRGASARLSNERIKKLKREVGADRPLSEMSIQELIETTHKISAATDKMFDPVGGIKEGLEQPAEVYGKLQEEIAGEIQRRRSSGENGSGSNQRQTIPGF